MTAVSIKGTFKKDSRPGNGLEEISADIVREELRRWVVVGIVEQHKVSKAPGEAPIPTVRFVAIEPLLTDDAAEQATQMLDQARKTRGLVSVQDTLFDAPSDELGASEDGPDATGSVLQPDAWLDDGKTR